ncbi:MAG: pilus assembly protein [Acidobacteriota bacterium]|nr:pilus assembly protein [Acidobacteriota bacterium]
MPARSSYAKLLARFQSFWRDTEASQILEFAVALPLLAVFIVGIYDFSGAFNLRQKLSNAAREAALLGANQLTSDLDDDTTPVSILAIRDEIDSYLLAAQVNDCGLGNPTLSSTAVMTWTASGSCTRASSFTVTIERGYATLTSAGEKVLCTRVSLSYPYQWRFNSIIQTLVPGASYGNVQITTVSTFPNMN